LSAWRPCDSVETVVAWKAAIEKVSGPSALVFSRQGLPCQPRDATQLANIARGAYVLRDAVDPSVVIIATGSEVEIAVAAFEILSEKGISARVVSMPCSEVFEAQDSGYREAVLPASLRARIAVEAAHPDYWRKWVGLDGAVVGLPTFGASGPGADVFEHFGFTADAVVAAAEELI